MCGPDGVWWQAELLTAAGLLDNGIEVIRLNSRKYKVRASFTLQSGDSRHLTVTTTWQGCGTFKDCDHHGINLQSKSPDDTKRNWFAFYCRERTDAAGHVSDCHYGPDYRCFSRYIIPVLTEVSSFADFMCNVAIISWDSNWTLNAVLVKKTSMLNKEYTVHSGKKSLAAIGLSQWEKQVRQPLCDLLVMSTLTLYLWLW